MSEAAAQCRGNVGGGEGGGGGGMRTVECLRGRLQAERVASKAAKEEADQLATRLDELEKTLADEVKVRNKAERRLRRAIKRLESLKILDVQLSLSESSIGSLSSNSNGQQAPEMEERSDPAGSLTSTVDSVRSGPRAGGEDKGWDGDSAKGSSAGSCTQANSSQDGSWFSVVSEQSGSGLCKEESRVDPDGAKSCGGSGDIAAAADVGHDSQRESEQPAASSGSSKSEASYRDEEDDRLALVLVDNPHYTPDAGLREENARAYNANDDEEREAGSNKLAIVLADPELRDEAPAKSGGGNDVQSVLLALRQVKEQLRYTIERSSEGLVAHHELYGHRRTWLLSPSVFLFPSTAACSGMYLRS